MFLLDDFLIILMIDDIFADGYRLRYSGGMVPDLHQILLKGGGLFSYPSTSDVPKGKLRLIFEVFPFAFVFEKAGGGSVDGKGRILATEVMTATPAIRNLIREAEVAQIPSLIQMGAQHGMHTMDKCLKERSTRINKFTTNGFL